MSIAPVRPSRRQGRSANENPQTAATEVHAALPGVGAVHIDLNTQPGRGVPSQVREGPKTLTEPEPEPF